MPQRAHAGLTNSEFASAERPPGGFTLAEGVSSLSLTDRRVKALLRESAGPLHLGSTRESETDGYREELKQ